jgi:hypothetical protein
MPPLPKNKPTKKSSVRGTSLETALSNQQLAISNWRSAVAHKTSCYTEEVRNAKTEKLDYARDSTSGKRRARPDFAALFSEEAKESTV